MKRPRISFLEGRRKSWGVLLLAVLSLMGIGNVAPVRHICASAHQVVAYYRALGEAGVRAGVWQRVALSLMLASTDSTRDAPPRKSPRPCPDAFE